MNSVPDLERRIMADTADAAEAVPPAETIEVPEQAEQEVAEQEENEENVDNVENEVPKEDPPPVVPACPTLCHLYGEGAFPAKELVPSVPMSPFVASCWPEKSPKGTEWTDIAFHRDHTSR